jgi:hypothetical protein
MDGLDDLAAVDALHVDGRDAKVAVSELARDDDQRHAFAGYLDGVSVTELVWREPAPHSRRAGGAPQLGTCRSGRLVPSARRAVDDACLNAAILRYNSDMRAEDRDPWAQWWDGVGRRELAKTLAHAG